jgi:hypothetical protein
VRIDLGKYEYVPKWRLEWVDNIFDRPGKPLAVTMVRERDGYSVRYQLPKKTITDTNMERK